MKKRVLAALTVLCVASAQTAFGAATETTISLSDEKILVNGKEITEEETAAVYLDHKNETHEDVPEGLTKLENRVITITDGYIFSSVASDPQYEGDGLYTEITSYTGGTQLHHGGTVTNDRPSIGGQRPEDMEGQRGQRPEGMEPNGRGGGPRQMESSSDTITEEFRLSKDSKTFTNVSSVVNDSTFTDVAKDAWYYSAVTSAAAQGILKGDTETTFSPSATMTRGEALEAMYALAGKPATGTASFSDVDAGVISSNQKSLRPQDYVTKAEAATMLVNVNGFCFSDRV